LQQDYYPFGMLMPGRSLPLSNYRFGFNGKEKDNELKGGGNSLDYGARIYDPRLGRFISIDPDKELYSKLSPYQGLNNNPINFVDPTGKGATPQIEFNDKGEAYILVSSTVYLYTNDPKVNLSVFKTKYESELNAAMNPCGNDPNNLYGMPTAEIAAPKEYAAGFRKKAGQATSLPVIYQTNVQVVLGGTKEAIKAVLKAPKIADNFYEVYSGSEDAADFNSAEGLINSNANPNAWVHERLHDLGWMKNGNTHADGTNEPYSIMNQRPGIQFREMRPEDSHQINNGEVLKDKTSMGTSVKPKATTNSGNFRDTSKDRIKDFIKK